jgi:hypothetical protein
MTRTPTARSTSGRAVVLVAAALALVWSGGVAYAYWAATGAGTATTGSATALPLGVSAVTTPTASLYPGKTEDLGLLLSNQNPYPVSLTKLTAASVTSSDPAACPASNVVLPLPVTAALASGGYALPAPVAVPAGSTAVPASLSGFITLTATAPDGCQARTFTVSLSFSGSQVA